MNDPALFQSRKARLIPGDLIFYWGGGFLSWAIELLSGNGPSHVQMVDRIDPDGTVWVVSKTLDPLKRVTITVREDLLKRGITKARSLDMLPSKPPGAIAWSVTNEAAQLTAAQAAYDAAKAAFESASEALVAAGGTPD